MSKIKFYWSLLRQTCVMTRKRKTQRALLVAYILIFSLMLPTAVIGFMGERTEVETDWQVVIPKKEKERVLKLYTKDEAKEYIRAEAEKAGIVHVDILLKTISCESKFNQLTANKNTNGTWDKGIWMINSIHKVPDECAYDLECSTKWAMQKIKERKFSPWVCFTTGLYKKEII